MTSLLQFGSTGAFRQRGAGGAGQLRADGDGAGGVAVRVVRPAAVLALVPRPEVRDGERHPACPFVVRDHLYLQLSPCKAVNHELEWERLMHENVTFFQQVL